MDGKPIQPKESIEALRAEVLSHVSPGVAALAPELSQWAKDFIHPKVWARGGLSKRDRSIATIGALVALNCPIELKLHVLRGLSNGLTKEEIGEIIMQVTPYVGFPLATTAAVEVSDLLQRAEVEEAAP